MSFFQIDYEAPNIESSIPSLADAVASVSNALVHLDEYKNGIDIKKLQFLKDIWGGVGRMRMNMDKDKKREQARVDSAVIITGQEMPTADPALFTRLIYLTYDKHSFSEQERQEFADLQHWRMLGASHITIEILKHRDKFEASFGNAWRKAEADVKYALRGEGAIVDRIQGNWTVLLATYIALEDVLQLPYTYADLLELSIRGILRQNEMSASVDEVAGFWNIISSAIQKGILMKDQDYKIRYKRKLRTSKQKDEMDFEKNIPILMIRRVSCSPRIESKGTGWTNIYFLRNLCSTIWRSHRNTTDTRPRLSASRNSTPTALRRRKKSPMKRETLLVSARSGARIGQCASTMSWSVRNTA